MTYYQPIEKREWDAESIYDLGTKHACVTSTIKNAVLCESVFCPTCWGFMVITLSQRYFAGHAFAECGHCGTKLTNWGAQWYWEWHRRYSDDLIPVDFARVSHTTTDNVDYIIRVPRKMYNKYLAHTPRIPRTAGEWKLRREYKGDWNPDSDYEQMLKELKENS